MKKPILKSVNIPYIVCNTMIGKQHKPLHRCVCGIVIMFVGVIISHSFTGYIVTYIVEVIGNGLHGIGMLPFAELLYNHNTTNDV